MTASVCMATYNGEQFVREQIMSILSQIGKDDELIISDDSSTDNTVSVIKNIKDPRIRLLENNHFRNHTQNFQHALKHAVGEYIFLSDQDDVWLECKYQECIELLQNYDLVVNDSIVTDQELKVIKPSFFEFFGSKKGIIKNIVANSYYGSCMAFRKKILDYSMPFPETLEIGHDVWIGLVAELIGEVYFYPKALIFYRRHSNALTLGGLGKSNRSLFVKVRGRMIMFIELFKFYTKFLIHEKKLGLNRNAGL